MNKLVCDNLSIGYDVKSLIENISFVLKSSDILVLVGPNGCGKTTLLKTVSGILHVQDGTVFLDEKDLRILSDKDRARIMSVMLTEKRQFDYVTCFDIVAVGRYPYTGIMGRLSDHDVKVISAVMEQLSLSHLKDIEFDKLSDGQKQRVLLARALVQEPELLVLDEPTSYLDIGSKTEFIQIIRSLSRERHIGILMSLHELDLAAAIADQVITVTSDHRIDKIGKPEDVLTDEYIKELFSLKKGSYSLKRGFEFKEEIIKNQPGSHERTISSGNTHYIMIQGTMSNAGKSLLSAGLCRIFRQDGYRVAPFKSQNMALNSYITEDGLEMGRAQVMQAEAAGIKPQVQMNPILLKPTSDTGSQVILNGKVIANMNAKEYFEYKTRLIPDIRKAIEKLSKDNDIIVIEGAGSPAEINLKDNDIVNMGMAEMVDAPVILVGDIDRGGVFAQLFGTIELLDDKEKARVKGLIINKFRGDKTILDPGIDMLCKLSHVNVIGVLPYMDLNLDDEDSLSGRFDRHTGGKIDISVIRLPHISNFTDFNVFEQQKELSLRYVDSVLELESSDMVILPGSKNTIKDLSWLREKGLDKAICNMAEKGYPVVGICAGYQMLGRFISDPDGVEEGGTAEGLGLLNITTVLKNEKTRRQVEGRLPKLTGPLKALSNKPYHGYEIHMGETHGAAEVIMQEASVYGSYIHGIFDSESIVRAVVDSLSSAKGLEIDTSKLMDYRIYKEAQYDRLSDIMRKYIDMDAVYEMMGISRKHTV